MLLCPLVGDRRREGPQICGDRDSGDGDCRDMATLPGTSQLRLCRAVLGGLPAPPFAL